MAGMLELLDREFKNNDDEYAKGSVDKAASMQDQMGRVSRNTES